MLNYELPKLYLTGLAILVILYRLYKDTVDLLEYRPPNISKNASLDLTCIGEYSPVLSGSVSRWLYNIMVLLHRKGKPVDVYSTALVWNRQYNNDMYGYIADGIESARTKFLSDIENKSLQCPLHFRISCVSKTIEFNDYLDYRKLIEMLGGDAGDDNMDMG